MEIRKPQARWEINAVTGNRFECCKDGMPPEAIIVKHAPTLWEVIYPVEEGNAVENGSRTFESFEKARAFVVDPERDNDQA